MGFDQLHPALQYHIVNSVGWAELREVQEACVGPILDGRNVIVLAQTAGGKTEAAFFPLISRMLSERWSGLSILYLSPLRALLNNQEARLRGYFNLVGHVASVWHGDVPQSAKRTVLRDPPSCLLTTPESLEAMMASARVDHQQLLGDVRAVVVDEVHAFAGDDRGWHLLSLLSRVSKLAGWHLQRIGLSATVGNPEELVEWLGGGCREPGVVVKPAAVTSARAEVQLDHVGSLENAATVISRLHRGEKRLVFCDSRAQVEALAAELRSLDVRTFVTHSSLSREVRAHAESAFGEETACVMVATSALELGIDIGDLDHVIQVDSPGSVARFLQRMGRTGRRPGTTSNCLFLAIEPTDVAECAALIDLWQQGFVEPVQPPVLPFHIFAQQVMAMAMQKRGLGYGEWDGWLGDVPAFKALAAEDKRAVVDYMLDRAILSEDQGMLWFGREGEKAFGRRNYMELLSVFISAPTMTVRHGRSDIGTMDRLPLEVAFRRGRDDGEPILLTLAGRHWRVIHIDWDRKVVSVEESKYRGRSQWLGAGRAVSFELAQSLKRVLCRTHETDGWSRRARMAVAEVRSQHAWLREDAVCLRRVDRARWECWTFGGTLANALIAAQLRHRPGEIARADGVKVLLTASADADTIVKAVSTCLRHAAEEDATNESQEAAEALKFHLCVPPALARRTISRRWADQHAIQRLLECPIIISES